MDSLRCFNRGFLFGMVLFLLTAVFFSTPAGAGSSLCATVKIEIKQELTLERQAFDAHMRINNGLTHAALTDVGVVVNFMDAEGEVVLASSDPDDPNPDVRFFIRIDTMDNIDDVTGSGIVQPSRTADIHWLIIPAPEASDGIPQGKLYYVGATLTYKIGGELFVTEVTPDHIFVKPLPMLALDYFIPDDVYGDDPFTPEVEPPVPFSLGLRLKNNGAGTARDMKIESAQPRIISNDQGLLIGFNIEGSEVNGAPATRSLLADFGDIAPGASATARWIMTCTLSGQFTEFTADYSHSDELGGQLTSLIEQINTHFLVRDVLVDLPGRDGVRDFLARDGAAYRVFESEGVDTEVTDQSGSSSLNGSGYHYTWSLPVTAGFMYARDVDPHQGYRIIKEVVRSDGRRVKPENAWLSKTRNGQNWDYWINIFDANTSGSYTVVFEDKPLDQTPVLQHIPDRLVPEGTQVSFLVEATSPDGATPSLEASPLPALAGFTDHGDGTGVFDWTPAVGQAGTYYIVFAASNGPFRDTQRVAVTVTSSHDTDGDGMDDWWEILHFGDLSRDGTGDFDGDGISDLDEFLNGTDPTKTDSVPTMPVIVSPSIGEEADEIQPLLVIRNSIHPDGEPVMYVFEVFSDEEITHMVAEASGVTAASGVTTAWRVPVQLNENAWYHWRVRAVEENGNYTLWAYGSFFVNTENHPPGPFHLSRPGDGREVASLTPVLEVTNSRDPDNDILTYTFLVYEDAGATVLVTSGAGVPEGADGFTAWAVDSPLEDDTWYYWKVLAEDPLGAVTETLPGSFLVNTSNTAPDAPLISSPALYADVAFQSLDLVVTNGSDEDGDLLTYLFELDKVDTFDSPAKRVSPETAEGPETSLWHVEDLEDNTWYFWRARASDGAAGSEWARGAFFVNTINDPPPTPTHRNPGVGSWARTLTPETALNPVFDPDFDMVSYEFEIFSDPDFLTLVAEGESDQPAWSPPYPLTDARWYYWRGRAVDEHGIASEWTTATPFFVMEDHLADPPSIELVEPAQDVLTSGTTLPVVWEAVDPEGNADIALFYDTDGLGGDSVLIVEGLREGENDNTYVWNHSGVADGTYHIYGVISDGTKTDSDYAPGRVTIDRTPPVVTAQPGGGVYPSPQGVVLSSDEPASIYFTLDDTDPTSGSSLYVAPIEINESATLRFMGVDEAGNQSAVTAETYTIQQEITVHVLTDRGRDLPGVKVYAFTEAGSYTGRFDTTCENGVASFSPADFAGGNYRFRVDYLRSQYWSEVFSLPGPVGMEVVIPEETVEVDVSMASGPVQGVRVYLFSGSGSYLGQYGFTDEAGRVTFYLPVGKDFKFRADVLGSQYWSDTHTITEGGINSVPVDAGGGRFQVSVEKDQHNPIEGIRVYLFKASGAYVGRYEVTDASGVAAFDVPEGLYKVRADYLGYRFWSDTVLVEEDAGITLSIPHQAVDITVEAAFQGETEPVQGVRVYLFNEAGTYTGRYLETCENGMVSFYLPQQEYLVRADYLRRHYWSEPFTWDQAVVTVPMADAEITVTGAGLPRGNVKVYAFTAQGAYVGVHGTTDEDGKALLRVSEGDYLFRADYLGHRFWSPESALARDQVNPVNISTGGGAFTVSVIDERGDPLTGVKTYVFNEGGSYVGLQGSTDEHGEVSFELSDGTYQFRVDYLGARFWGGPATVPEDTSTGVLIEHELVQVSVNEAIGPSPDVKVHLFSETGKYLGVNEVTDENGLVDFRLPAGEAFQFRADILRNRYWSDIHTVTMGGTNFVGIHAGGGLFTVTLEGAMGLPMEGVKVYLFNDSDSYLGLFDFTDAGGKVIFGVPEGTYKVRADYLGYRFWSPDTLVDEDAAVTVAVPHQDVTVHVRALYQGEAEPVPEAKVYLFTEEGSYTGLVETSDAEGETVFSVPERPYKARADYLRGRFWSEPSTWQDVFVDVPMAEAEVTVTGAGLPHDGVRVYAFTESGSYVGLMSTTDAQGRVLFRLPEGVYRFRADYQGSRFWSADSALAADQTSRVDVSVGGGSFTLNVLEGMGQAIEGIKCYVFTEAGSYVGLLGSTDGEGNVTFDLADGSYKFRMDYLGYRYWSRSVTVPADTSLSEAIPHQEVAVTVQGDLGGDIPPLSGVRVYLFRPDGAYVGRYHETDQDGRVVFNLPEQAYEVRADYLRRRFWSDSFTWQDTTVSIPEGIALVHVTMTGEDVEGCRVYAFSGTTTYTGRHETTDSGGLAPLRLPAGHYHFRADHQRKQYWGEGDIQSGVTTGVQIDTGGGEFTLYLDNGRGPLAGARTYVFSESGAYMGLSGRTDDDGEARFMLSDGPCMFRVDHLGYRFWSPVFQVPVELSGALTIPHQDITVTVEGLYQNPQPLEGLKTYLFNPSGSYMGLQEVTDAHGQAGFYLPPEPYRVRVDYLRHRFWSEDFQAQDTLVTVPEGLARLHVLRSGAGVEGARVYLFNEDGAYTGRSSLTDAGGLVEFLLPDRTFKFRVDHAGSQHWTPVYEIVPHQVNDLEMDLD